MARARLLLAVALPLLLVACSSDDPKSDGGGDQGPVSDTAAPAKDGPQTIGDTNKLPWDQAIKPDLANVSCTPGDPAMCDEDKTLFCDNGKCVNCPPAKVDCDRQGDCECFGACVDDKCAAKPPKK